jgi:mono/diheme cytochrome c family protein
MDYPIFDVAIGGSVLMGLVAVTHVIVSHFAIGGGLVIAATETIAWRRGDPEMRDLAKRSSLMLILVSTVFGAISGVGIWVVAGLIAPATISALIHTYVWGWAIEWVFFIVEIVAALVYYATWGKIARRTHVMIGWIYFVAAYFSMVVINGIITFQLTPGTWLETGKFWDGFFNPTYWPGLVVRTGIVLIMAVAFMSLPVLKAGAAARPRLARYLGWWLMAGVLLAYGGYRWWEGALPESVRGLFLGDSPTLVALADTRSFLLWSLTATLVLCAVFLLAAPRALRMPTAILLMVAGFAFFGGYERLREGTRKPFLIHDYMFSNGVLVSERESNGEPEQMGRAVFRAQCASCHTIDGYQAIRPLVDPDFIDANLYALWDQGEEYAALEPGQAMEMSELSYPFMPPFVGTEEELEALSAYLSSLAAPAEAAAAGGQP